MDYLNDTLSTITPEMMNLTSGVTSSGMINKPKGYIYMILIKVVYAIGIVGNTSAIIALRRGERRMRNRKHLLLLTSIAANDLVALVGMMCLLVVSEQVPELTRTKTFCAARVVLRIFGIGSVCITVTMALERYLALTRPFLYQKQVTYYVIRTALLVSWFWAAILTCAPIFGLGLYFDEAKLACTRYRNAVTTTDYAYAIFYVVFGTFLCGILVYCNLAVIQVLYAISSPGSGGQTVVRRVSKSSCRERQRTLTTSNSIGPHHNAATAEEVAFSRLMATLSVLFMVCWLPQMITSTLYLVLGSSWWDSRFLKGIAMTSDLLMLLNYVLNPILYVLMRQRSRLSISALCHSITNCFKRNHINSTESMKTSCCPQETILVSDSSGAELQPLRSRPVTSPHNNAVQLINYND